MAKVRATRQQVIDLLKSGEWEIGFSEGIRTNGRFWMQKGGLCKGGETLDVHGNTAESLLKAGILVHEPRREDDKYWLRRYRLKAIEEHEK